MSATPASLDKTTPAQAATVKRVAERFRCWPDDLRVHHDPFDLPEGWILVCVGESKGRPFTFGVSPEGEASS